jgi:hypothetical protein
MSHAVMLINLICGIAIPQYILNDHYLYKSKYGMCQLEYSSDREEEIETVVAFEVINRQNKKAKRARVRDINE